MEYKTGDRIPDNEVLVRFMDDEGGVYVEIKGEKEFLYRIGENNSLFFKVERTDKLMGELRLLDDFRSTEDYMEQPEKEEEEPEVEPSDEITLKIDAEKIQKKLAEITFEEGTKIPDGLKSQCKKNEYGGYSLEFNNYFYVLDAGYRVEIRRPVKTKAPTSDFTLEADDLVTPAQDKGDVGEPVKAGKVVLDKGDILPEHLRSRCEVDLSAGSGFRIEVDNSTYILDEDYRVVVKMSHHYQADEEEPVVPQPEPAAAMEQQQKQDSQQHPPEKIVESVLKKFKIAIKVDRVSVDLFLQQTLIPANKPVFLNIYQGDLTELNEDTKAAAKMGRITKLKTGGISLLKAALLHELYMKSTFSGRGERMLEFLTHIISPWKDAALTITQKDLYMTGQERLLDFTGKQSDIYGDIGDVIHRIYMEIKGSVFEEYRKVQKEGSTLFKAFLINKLYEKISRPERGDGISLIILVKNIMDFQG